MFWTVLLLLKVAHASLNYELISDFCEAKYVTFGTVFTCRNSKENVECLKNLAEKGLRFLVADMRGSANNEEVLYRKYYNFAVVVDGYCLNFTQSVFSDKKHFYEPYHWLIMTTSANESLNILKKFPLNINSDVNLAVKTDMTKWTIFDIYNQAFNHSGTFIATNLGTYNHRNFPARPPQNIYWRRKNMTGVHFTSAVVVPDDRINFKDYLTSEKDRQIHSMHRFQSVTIRYCQEMFNFSLVVKKTDSWGYLTPNGHFDGLVGLLERRLVDFGSSPLIYKLDRMPVVDYSYGNWILRSTFIYRRPKIVEASYKIFMRPLAPIVWICIVLMMAVLMLFLKLIFSREKRLLREQSQVESSWSLLFLFTLGAFCQQGATCHPQLISSRTLSIFVFLFCILVYQFYSASIVSYLLMDPPRKINNLKDLADSDLKPGIEDILIDRNYFVQTTDPVAIQLFDKKIKTSTNNSGFYEPADGLKLVKTGGFAFHVETSTAYPIIEETFTNQEICELEEVQMYRTQPMHTNLQKNSSFREMMNYCMLHLVENGLMFRLRKYWDARTPVCIESAKKVSVHVGIKEFSSGLIVLFYGLCASLLMLLVELVVSRRFCSLERNVVRPYVD